MKDLPPVTKHCNLISARECQMKLTRLLLVFLLLNGAGLGAEEITLFGKNFYPDFQKVVVVGYRSADANGYDPLVTNLILERLVIHNIPCWTEKDFLYYWAQESFRNALQDVELLRKQYSSGFKNIWFVRCFVESNTRNIVGRYAIGTARVAVDVIDGNTFQVISSVHSAPMGTSSNPGWVGETVQSAESSAVQAALSEVMSYFGMSWWKTPLWVDINLRWAGTQKVTCTDKPAAMAFLDEHLLYTCSRGCYQVNLHTGESKEVGAGLFLTVATSEYGRKIAISQPGQVQLWSFTNSGPVKIKDWSTQADVTRLRFSSSGKFIAGAGGGMVFLWDDEGRLRSKRTFAGSLLDIAPDDGGTLYVLKDKFLFRLGEKEEKTIDLDQESQQPGQLRTYTIGAIADDGVQFMLGCKTVERTLDAWGAMGAARHFLRIYDQHGRTVQLDLPDDPTRTRTPQQAVFLKNGLRFLLLAVRHEANRQGYLALWDFFSHRQLLIKELPGKSFPEKIAVSADGRRIAALISGESDISIYQVE